MILSKKWANHKVESCIYCVNQFLREKCHKRWNQKYKQKQCLLFNFYILIFWPLELRKYDVEPLFLKLIFTYFSVINNSGKFKEISWTRFYWSYLLNRKCCEIKRTVYFERLVEYGCSNVAKLSWKKNYF